MRVGRLRVAPERSIVKELGYVGAKQDGSAAKRYLERGGESDEVLACYRRIQGYLQRLSVSCTFSPHQVDKIFLL